MRAYCQEQWLEMDARVEPISITQRGDGSFAIEVHQVVRDLSGTVIADSIVHRVYRFDGEFIAGMALADDQ